MTWGPGSKGLEERVTEVKGSKSNYSGPVGKGTIQMVVCKGLMRGMALGRVETIRKDGLGGRS